ncbi:MAG: hypothetical protein OXG40_06180 [Acidimicrobiaceae bacterium]|nr:hypothetical protein [Acidimicrobiaceae bacterium]MDE0517191.1 hypothetical protein [Acidimicrobiaceae bacterium]MDE0657328.1 hypothetical protein [Acidimicrobiaceae bacterium]MYF43063.1 hypothetical protein [Acidimicrobiaceae bacterium]MYJ35041.1 hypothetical protein [Acidimicrobiaceae bacterium]
MSGKQKVTELMLRVTLALLVVLTLAGAGLVVDAAVDPEPASAHTKCEGRYVQGVVGYHTTQVAPSGPQDSGVRPDYSRPIYGPVWTQVCGIPHGHWYHVVVCTTVATVAASAATGATGGNPVAGGVAAGGTYVACEQVLRWAHS